MGITYRKLREILIERKMKCKELVTNAGVGWSVIVKINKDEYVTLESLEKIARYLDLEIGDIVEKKIG